jgi:hypothetical protein
MDGDAFIGKEITMKYYARDFTQGIESKPTQYFDYTFKVVGTYDNLVNGERPDEIYIPKGDIRLVNENIDAYSIGIGNQSNKTIKVIINDASKREAVKQYLNKNNINAKFGSRLDISYFIVKYMLMAIIIMGFIIFLFSAMGICCLHIKVSLIE